MSVKDFSEIIKTRWAAFIDFKRKGSSGMTVMSTKSNDITDLLPGDYDLVQLVQTQYHEIPTIATPRHAVLKGSKWIEAKKGEREGKFFCSLDWNGTIPVEFGTNHLLAYYGASLVGQKDERISVSQRHCTVNFTYSKSYHEDYVVTTCGGNGLEQHAFHHMECPLDDDSGFFLLGKWVEKDELHLTAFKILKNHIVYVPANTIHSNDHLLGTWRTMLSDADDAPVNHVIMYTSEDKEDKTSRPVDVTFDTSIAHFGRSLEKKSCQNCSNRTRNRGM